MNLLKKGYRKCDLDAPVTQELKDEYWAAVDYEQVAEIWGTCSGERGMLYCEELPEVSNIAEAYMKRRNYFSSFRKDN
jgi:hypothetical protein